MVESVITRLPSPALRPFVRRVWVSDEPASPHSGRRERVLPTGLAHVVVRLTDHPLRLFDGIDDPSGRVVSRAVVGGPRATHYVRDVSQPVRSVGAQLQPGAVELLLGAPADALAHRHTPLADLWGRAADEARERLLEAGDPEAQLILFERLLAARLPRVRGVHPAVAHALARFDGTDDVGGVARESGYSHRRFIALFRRAVGLGPKRYSRMLRFQRALATVENDPRATWVDVALAAGYGDQSHFTRDFRELTGMTPGEYRALSPAAAHHVPVAEVKNRQDPPRGRGHDRPRT
jgi:AraC-like DNA-binding protein